MWCICPLVPSFYPSLYLRRSSYFYQVLQYFLWFHILIFCQHVLQFFIVLRCIRGKHWDFCFVYDQRWSLCKFSIHVILLHPHHHSWFVTVFHKTRLPESSCYIGWSHINRISTMIPISVMFILRILVVSVLYLVLIYFFQVVACSRWNDFV